MAREREAAEQQRGTAERSGEPDHHGDSETGATGAVIVARAAHAKDGPGQRHTLTVLVHHPARREPRAVHPQPLPPARRSAALPARGGAAGHALQGRRERARRLRPGPRVGSAGVDLQHPAAQQFFLFVEAAFGTVAMTIYTVVAAALLAWRKHVRAAVWTVGVMLAAALTTWGIKGLLARKRPVWEEPITTLTSFSFPSGHATGIAAAAWRRRRAGRPAGPAPGGTARARPFRARARAARLPGPDLPRRAQRLRRRRRRLRGCVLGADRAGGLRPGTARQAPRGVQHTGADHPAARRDPQPDQGRGRRRVPGDGRRRGRRRRVEHPDLVDHHDRGPGPLDGRAGRGLRGGAGDRLRR